MFLGRILWGLQSHQHPKPLAVPVSLRYIGLILAVRACFQHFSPKTKPSKQERFQSPDGFHSDQRFCLPEQIVALLFFAEALYLGDIAR